MNDNKYEYFTIKSNDALKRIDNVIRKFLPNMPLKSIFKSIRSGDIRVNSLKVKQNQILQVGDILGIYKPFLNHIEKKSIISSKYSIDKNRIIFENNDILIYNKPRGVLVHGEKDSLDILIRSYLQNKVEESLSFSPGPLHRLDRNTQGLIIFSISVNGARTVSEMIKKNEISKFYLTVVDGTYNKKEHWVDKLSRDEKTLMSYASEDGKVAISTFIPLISKNNKTMALINIETGRTHQIRVQCAIHNRPLTGDLKYNNKTEYNEYFLSAISLTFTKKSDIINQSTFSIPLEKTESQIITKLFPKSEIKKVELLIQEELNHYEHLKII